MTEMGSGYYGQPNEGNPFQEEDAPIQQPPAWYRQAMDKMGEQQRELRSQIEALTAENNRNKVADALESKGFSRSAAALYQGSPDKVDEWLTQHGSSLARSDQAPAAPVQQSGPPQSTVPAEGQAAMQQMADAGAGGVVSMASDDEISAALRAVSSPEEFQKIAQAHGWQHTLGDRY